jgi:magnesium transporter
LRITEGTDALKDGAYSLLEMHTNAVGLRMNEIMKILTLITTIFTPIMFMASVYGTNFVIPETKLPSGYRIFWGFTILLTILQFYFFKRKKWL